MRTTRATSRLSTSGRPLAAHAFCLASIAACSPAEPSEPARTPGPPWFEDVTDEVGIRTTHDPGLLPTPETGYFLPQIAGSGGALFDANEDGRLDAFVLNNGGVNGAVNRLYLQRDDGTFEDATDGSGLDVSGYGMGAAAGDVTNDGLTDVVVAEYGATRVFVSAGDGTFREGEDAGVVNPWWGVSVALVDFDRDGWLDVAVANYLDHDGSKVCEKEDGPDYCGPAHYPGSPVTLYRNLGSNDTGEARFEDVTEPAGLTAKPDRGLGIVALDLTGDRWPDLLVANDASSNSLWVNRGDGTFAEEALVRGIAYPKEGVPRGNMGIAIGDVDGNGLLDAFVTHLAMQKHTLWMQGPEGVFEDATARSGLGRPLWQGTGFGTAFLDFDLDGDLDAAIVNGGVIRRTDQAIPDGDRFWDPYMQRNQLFENDGTAIFTDVSLDTPAFSEPVGVSRGLAFGDLDRDGDVDLLVTRLGGTPLVYRNVAPRKGSWIGVRCVLPASGGRDALGAIVRVVAGEREWTSAVVPSEGYVTSSEPIVHLGLGPIDGVDEIVVTWPDGTRESFAGGPANRVVTLAAGAGTASE